MRILKAGATYVPLDEQAPAARLAYIARNAGVRCLVTSVARATDWEPLLAAGAPLETLVVAGAAGRSGGSAGTPDDSLERVGRVSSPRRRRSSQIRTASPMSSTRRARRASRRA